MVQGLRLHAPNGEGQGLIPGQGARYCMPQIKRPCVPQLRLKILCSSTKTKCSQINKFILFICYLFIYYKQKLLYLFILLFKNKFYLLKRKAYSQISDKRYGYQKLH